MKDISRRQYITTLLVSFAAIAVLSVCTISAFYKKAVKDTRALGVSALEQQKEQMDAYMSRAMDAVEVTAITVEYMMRQNRSGEEILDFLTDESKYYREDVDDNFTGIYGWINGEYLDGIGWTPEEGYVAQEREWYTAAVQAKGKPAIVQPYLDAQTGDVMISVSQLLYDKKSVISLDVSLSNLQENTEEIQLNGQGYGFICDKTGQVITHSDKKEVGQNYEKNTMKPVYEKVKGQPEKSFQIRLNDRKCTVFSTCIMKEWYVVMVVNNEGLYRSIRRLQLYDVALSLLVYLVVVIFCTMSMRRTEHTLDQLDASNSELQEINDTMLQVLAKTIDAKDKYTKGHSVRVAKYSRELARRMGKSLDEQEEIYKIGLLHDMGKIRIPDTIINKPGKLDEQEFSMIKLHTVTGYHILKGIKKLKKLAEGAKYHHERYDGKGYPSGLKGENITEYARIIAVADSYDAMASNRSYRNALPQEVVRSEIEKGKGTQFDPQVADIMLQMIDEDTAYQMKQTDELKKRILVVDDEQMNIRMVQRICREEPMYEIYTAQSGQEAIELLQHQRMDLVLLDLEMPQMDGFETLTQIRTFTEIPVAFITATKDYEVIEKARQMAVEDYITKPFLPAVFLETLHGIIS